MRNARALLPLTIAVALAAGPPPAAAVAVRVKPPALAVLDQRLANGLRVLLLEDHTVPVVSVQVWYHVGGKNEPPGRSGFAHLFEHLMFKGSAHVAARGAQPLHPVDRRARQRHHRLGSHPLFRDHSQQLSRARPVDGGRPHADARRLGGQLPRRARRGRGGAAAAHRRSAVRTAARDRASPRPSPPTPTTSLPIGSMADLDAATIEDVRDFYRTWYVPNNATLVIAGDLDPGPHHALDRDLFRPHPAGAAAGPREAARAGSRPRSGARSPTTPRRRCPP